MFCWLYLSHTGWLTSLPTLSALNHLLPVSSGVISLPYCSQLFAHFHLCSKTEKWRRGRKRLNIKRPGEKKKKLHWHGKLFSVTGFPVHFNAESCFVAAASGGRQRNCSWTTCRFNSSTLQPEVNKHDWIFLSCNWHSFSPSILIR